jgi:hypothetical protein
MDAVPIIGAFLSKKIRPSQMLRLIIPNQAVKVKGKGVFRLFNSIIEPSSEDGVLDSTEFSSLSLDFSIS